MEIDKADKIISAEHPDIIVCLGDIFDSHFKCGLEHQKAAALWIKRWLWTPNFHCLTGNHDITQYGPDNRRELRASGYDERADYVINNILNRDDWNKLMFFCWVDDYLLTHAGLNPIYLSETARVNKNSIDKMLKCESACAQNALLKRQNHWFFNVGCMRFGPHIKGGILWQDFKEFALIPGVNQIFGHTYGKGIRCVEGFESGNFCIDTNLMFYMTITNGVLEQKSYLDL